MKLLLLGKNGQLGWALQRALLPLGELIAVDRSQGGDLTQLDTLKQLIRDIKPHIIINAAAYTAVDKAEEETTLAERINAEAPAVLAQEAAALNALLVHYSTDYVFNGSGTAAWKETDPTAPLNVYGHSKLMGERAIQAFPCKHLIFRTSWVYSTCGNNFIKTILRLAQERSDLRIIQDQIGAPTSADLLADITAHVLRIAYHNNNTHGLYHVAPMGETSWFDYAQLIIKEATDMGKKFALQQIIPIASEAYKTPAKRPLNSRLDTQKLTDTFSIHLPNWQIGVQRVLREFLGKSL